MKRFCTILLAIASALAPHTAMSQDLAHAQDTASMSRAALMEERVQEIITDAQLDTINVKKKLVINDYAMIGFQYGVGLSQVMWNPKQKQDMLFVPVNAGVTVTKYAKMFGFLPYFGFQAGLFYAREGYRFKYDKDNDYTYTVEGAEKAIMDVIEVPLLLQCHVDLWNFKFMVNLGCYGGYRLAIERFPGKSGSVAPEVQHSFLPTDRRWDYGIKGGVGFGLVFDPVEIHIQAMYKHSMSTLYNPDYYSEYYYRFAYPTNIVISAGVHFQITKRTGKTKAQLKKMARDMVYQTNENISINGND
ncbi:MAG: PorT family protein [Bacteroidales bacterium]|nr:porin family protein [Bacteroidales bacterium]